MSVNSTNPLKFIRPTSGRRKSTDCYGLMPVAYSTALGKPLPEIWFERSRTQAAL